MSIRFLRDAAAVSAALFFMTAAAVAQHGVEIQTQAAADMVGEFRNTDESKAADSIGVRGVELLLHAELNQLTKARINFAAHSHDGESQVMLHEALIDCTGFLPDSRLRLGQFFLGFGLLNKTHTHDWLFVDAPYYYQRFFGSEGVADTGAEVKLLQVASLPIEVTLGVSNGRTFDDPHAEGAKPAQPTQYLRIGNALSKNAKDEHSLGANIIRRRDSEGTDFLYYGVDADLNWYNGAYTVFLLQGEAWLRMSKPKLGETERLFGAFIYPEYGFSETWQIGLRGDYYRDISLKDAAGDFIENYNTAVVPTVSYSPQEELIFRAAFRHQVDHKKDLATTVDQAWLVQSVFMFGAHVH